MTTIRDALKSAYAQLARSSTPRLDAQVLLCEVLKVEKSYLVAFDERELAPAELHAFARMLARREAGEPIAYIRGTAEFYGLEFAVSPDVLIPRPETEHLVEAALQWGHQRDSRVAADIGTGSGAIAVTVAKHLPGCAMHAVDVSEAALTLAQRNARANGVTMTFHQGHLAQPLIEVGMRVDLLLANLPYIRSDELPTLEVSQHEPLSALDGGADGLDFIRELLGQVPQVCEAGALILLEIGAEQGRAVADFARKTLQPSSVQVMQDYAGLDRVVRIALP